MCAYYKLEILASLIMKVKMMILIEFFRAPNSDRPIWKFYFTDTNMLIIINSDKIYCRCSLSGCCSICNLIFSLD